jgi:DNA polymerase III gamma/tau subunit
MVRLLTDIAKRERVDADATIIELCAVAAAGSPRQALVNLSLVDGCQSRAEARMLLQASVP